MLAADASGADPWRETMATPVTAPRLSEDAAIVLALAGTAVWFAASIDDEADCWLRVMRLHGEVGCALQALGVPAAPLETSARAPEVRQWRVRTLGEDAAEMIGRRASDACRARGAPLIRTGDVLEAVIDVYGPAFERVLEQRGTGRDELLTRLHEPARPPGRPAVSHLREARAI